MSRNGAGVYSLPAGSVVANGDLSDAADINTPFADIAADLNIARPIVAGGTGATTASGALVNLGLTPTAVQLNATYAQIAGRNRIINGQGRINQRAYVSGTATGGANQYTLDRWRVVTSGQSLTFTGNDATRTMTAPAGGCEQVIEGANIEGGTYVINWTGTATCTVNGVSRATGATFTLTANTAATVRMIGGTFTDVQLELGTVATPFERLPISDEFARCRRYYETGSHAFSGNVTSAATYAVRTMFNVPKRTSPSVSATNTSASQFPASAGTLTTSALHIQESRVASGTAAGSFTSDWTADAEL